MRAAPRGKYFSSAPSGTITSICVYTSTSGETVNIGVKPNHDNAADTFTESITTNVAGDWSCKTVSHAWSASTLFVRRTGGTGHVGWDASSPYDSWATYDNQASWVSENYRRGYKLVIDTGSGGSTQTLQNGGTGGGGYDTASDRGKYFGSAPSGTITSICVYTSTSGETVTIGVKPNHDGAADTFTESITTNVAGGWTCKSVSHSWTASTLFIRRTGGTGHVGWDASSPYDSWATYDNQVTWVSENYRRGYKLDIQTSGGANHAPSACINLQAQDSLQVWVSGGCSSDPDGDSLSYDWNWGDSSTHDTSQTATHTYRCPANGATDAWTMTLTVTDTHSATGSQSQSVSTSSPDVDGDGLSACQESAQGTTDNDNNKDYDGDGLSDYVESTSYPSSTRDSIFCLANTCDYPSPTTRDIYVQYDWMHAPQFSTFDWGYGCWLQGCDFNPSTAVIDKVAAAFSAQSIRYHAFVSSSPVAYYHDTYFVPDTGQIDHFDFKYGNSGLGIPAAFPSNRYQVFHYFIMVGKLGGDNSGGVSYASDDDGQIPRGVLLGSANNDDTSFAADMIHELGHNLCLIRTGSAPSPNCVFQYIDNQNDKPATYKSAMNYAYSYTIVDYSHGNNGNPDHDDWGAIRPQDFADPTLARGDGAAH